MTYMCGLEKDLSSIPIWRNYFLLLLSTETDAWETNSNYLGRKL